MASRDSDVEVFTVANKAIATIATENMGVVTLSLHKNNNFLAVATETGSVMTNFLKII